MDDAELDDELEAYLNGSLFPNMEMVDVQVIWVEGNESLGALHIAGHNVTKAEVEEVLFWTPPEVEAKRHKDHPERTIFWGMTQGGRWLFISCDDWTVGETRFLRPITAFTPPNGRVYWDQQ
jgi:uncharacterized DUF497 family protein